MSADMIHAVLQDAAIVVSIIIGVTKLMPKSMEGRIALLEQKVDNNQKTVESIEKYNREGMTELSRKQDETLKYLLEHK